MRPSRKSSPRLGSAKADSLLASSSLAIRDTAANMMSETQMVKRIMRITEVRHASDQRMFR